VAIDLTVLCVVLFFGLLGAISGAARQLGHLLALGLAALAAGPVGTRVAPLLAEAADVRQGAVARVAASILVFLVVYLLVRLVATPLLRRALAGEEEERAGTDRALGFVLGGLKVAALAYVLLSAATFVEDEVRVAGRSTDLGLGDSVLAALARRYNLFSVADVGPARHLLSLAREAQTPEGARRMSEDPAFRALREDPRLREALESPELSEALRAGDWETVIGSPAIQRLGADPEIAARLEAAAGPR
jgi:membrane protein required for colicin V production